jgi:small GTP-binding protein
LWPAPPYRGGTVTHVMGMDTAGQERFEAITRSYLRDSTGVLLVFDLGNRNSFYDLRKRWREMQEALPEGIPVIAVGNKVDLLERPADEVPLPVNVEEATAWAEKHQLPLRFTSALTGAGVEPLFLEIICRSRRYLRSLTTARSDSPPAPLVRLARSFHTPRAAPPAAAPAPDGGAAHPPGTASAAGGGGGGAAPAAARSPSSVGCPCG